MLLVLLRGSLKSGKKNGMQFSITVARGEAK